jgi:hypothetical protein
VSAADPSANGTIHGGVHNYYQVPEGASAREKLRYALRFLEAGQATTARNLLAGIVVHIRDEPDVWFHWLLAFFSNRTLRELSIEDRAKLAAAREQIRGLTRNRWSHGIDVIEQLVDATAAHAADAATVPAAPAGLDRLDPAMRQDILRHLERVVQGPLKDELWYTEVEQARAGRAAGRRADRVWKFFEPDPAGPRVRPVRPAEVSAGHVALTALTTVAASGGVCVLGWLALRAGDTAVLIAVMTGLAAAGLALLHGAEWRYRVERLRAADRERRRQMFFGDESPGSGFAARVDQLYRRYAERVVPDPAERAAWLSEAYAPMCRLRDELVEVYRERRVPAAEIKWLIRFQVRTLRQEWADGVLAARRRRWTVPPAVRGGCAAGAVLAGACLVWAAQAAARHDPLPAFSAILAILIAGGVAAEAGTRIIAENKRVAVDEEDRRERLTAYWFECQRWRHRLDDRPDDLQMAAWLDCDRRVLLDQAIRADNLRWSDISAYASLEARGAGGRRARAKNGPWRYSRYKLLVFVLTADGVRQITVELDFAEASFHMWQRANYRYDAVAAVRVTALDDGTREFQLFLVNGTDIQVGVTEAGQAGDDEDSAVLADAAQDATGLRNTLFVLQGTAAEGRSWWAGPAYKRAG